MKRFAFFLVLLALVAGLSARPAQLKNFVELLNALQHGEEVSMVAHYGRATLMLDGQEGGPSPDATGGMKLDTWEYFAPMIMGNPMGFISFGECKLIENPLGEGYVYNYVRVRVMDNGTVEVTARYLNATTFEAQMDETYVGKMSIGGNDQSPYLFFAE